MSDDPQRDLEETQIAWHDVCYAVLHAIGIEWLARRLNVTEFRPWYREAAIRAEWKKKA